jgi:hypothetical protein
MTSPHFHAVIWIDHREARVFHFNPHEADKLVLHADNPNRHVHHHRALGSGHEPEDQHFLRQAMDAIADAGVVLILGPGQTKHLFGKFIAEHDPALAAKIAAVETADHPTDNQIVAHARKYFKAEDRTTPQTK